ncbi:MAG: tyrosine-type recombinase/integrase [Planctomycetes bacterium]|nr:tyrosine-type recombinase/integrase [Planctomycetota bacterium]
MREDVATVLATTVDARVLSPAMRSRRISDAVSAQRKRKTKRLPPYVQVRWERDTARIISYRGWAMLRKDRTYGPPRDDPNEAHRDAMDMRETGRTTPHRVVSIRLAHEAMIDELRDVVKPGTIEFYEDKARAVFRLLDPALPMPQLSAELVQQIIRKARASDFAVRTILHYRVWLNRLVNWCRAPQRQWFRGDNPVPLAAWPEADDPTPDFFREDELAAILERIEREAPEDYDLVLFMAGTGLRLSEMARLHSSHLDLVRGVFEVAGKRGKAQSPITAEIRPAAERLVARAAANDGWLVAARPIAKRQVSAEERRAEAISNVYRRWARKLGDRRFHAHALRHTIGTALARAHWQDSTIRRFLRHASLATTQRYVHLAADDLHGAAAQLGYLKGGASGERKHG